MKSLFYFLIIFCSILSSCQLKEKDNTEEITQIVDKIEEIVDKFDKNVDKALNDKKYDHISLMSKNTQESIDVKLTQLETMQVEQSYKKLQQTAIIYVKTLQDIVKAENQYANLIDSLSVDDVSKMDRFNLDAIHKAHATRLYYIETLNATKKFVEK